MRTGGRRLRVAPEDLPGTAGNSTLDFAAEQLECAGPGASGARMFRLGGEAGGSAAGLRLLQHR